MLGLAEGGLLKKGGVVNSGTPDLSMQRLHDMSYNLQKETQMELIQDQFDRQHEERAEAERQLNSIRAPISRAGYLVVGTVGLLVFWFLSTVVFNRNKMAIGIMLTITALFFLMMLKSAIEKKGARYIAQTGGVALGVM